MIYRLRNIAKEYNYSDHFNEYEKAVLELKNQDFETFRKAVLSNAIHNKIIVNEVEITDLLLDGMCSNLYDGMSHPFPPILKDAFDKYKIKLEADIDDYIELITNLENVDNLNKAVCTLVEGRVKYEVWSIENEEIEIDASVNIEGLIKLFEKNPKRDFKIAKVEVLNTIKELENNGITKQVYYNYKNDKNVQISKVFYYNLAIYLGLETSFLEPFLLLHGLSIQESKMTLDRKYLKIFDYGMNKEQSEFYLSLTGLKKKKIRTRIDIENNLIKLINHSLSGEYLDIYIENLHYCINNIAKAINEREESIKKKLISFNKHKAKYEEKPILSNLKKLDNAKDSLDIVTNTPFAIRDVLGKTVLEDGEWDKDMSLDEIKMFYDDITIMFDKAKAQLKANQAQEKLHFESTKK